MKFNFPRTLLFLPAAIFLGLNASAQNLDQIGVTLLRAVTTNVNGAGISVLQAEVSLTGDNRTWEVNPANVSQPVPLFTFISADGTANFYPNSLGTNSGHAETVGNNFYGLPNGVATNVTHVTEIEVNYFITNYISNLSPLPPGPVVSQSFTFGALAATNQQSVDSAYDDYATTYATLFVSAADNLDNDPTVRAPGTAYNCISVGAYASGNYYNSIGPTIDNGRCKPDITAPSTVTSFSTPQVAGAAALLMQAALRGDGGSDTNAAFDLRTIKALLLNGAVKPTGWTNANGSPLDARYGAGLLNVFNSYEELAGGKQNFCISNLIALGAPPLPVVITSSIPVLSGWDFNHLSSTSGNDAANHYLFNVSNGLCTATLVWNRQYGQTNINDLNLYLFNVANSNLVACSTSLVDNVEHVFVPRLAAGRYDLQVWKAGGSHAVSSAESYALAWAFVSPTMGLVKSGANAKITWPAYPAGFLVETTSNLINTAWGSAGLPSAGFTNGANSLQIPMTNAVQFFRLRQPDF